MGGRLLGWRTVCAVEVDAYARGVLLARQREGHLERFPIWDDVRTFNGKPWRGALREGVITAGWPCQDISAANARPKGLKGKKSGLWLECARIICEVEPRWCLLENSPMLTSRGLGVVLRDLAQMGFDASWGVLGAHHAGAPHKRDRIWIVARNTNSKGQPDGALYDCEASRLPCMAPNTSGHAIRNNEQRQESRRQHIQDSGQDEPQHDGIKGPMAHRERAPSPWTSQPCMGRVADGVANRVGRLRAIGNGQVPAVVALAWNTIKGELSNE